MKGEQRATYLDSSAIVKLVVREPETDALRRHLRARRRLVSSSLARAEVVRAVLPLGARAVRLADEVLAHVELVRVSDRVLDAAGRMLPHRLRSLDAIHIATASMLGAALLRLVTYDARMLVAARAAGLPVIAPT